MTRTRPGRPMLAGAVSAMWSMVAVPAGAVAPPMSPSDRHTAVGREAVSTAAPLEGAWARIAGQRCWAEQIEIAGNAITYQPPGPGPLRHTTFARTDPPAGAGDEIVLTLADGGRAALRMIDASHISDRQGCRYQRDD